MHAAAAASTPGTTWSTTSTVADTSSSRPDERPEVRGDDRPQRQRGQRDQRALQRSVEAAAAGGARLSGHGASVVTGRARGARVSCRRMPTVPAHATPATRAPRAARLRAPLALAPAAARAAAVARAHRDPRRRRQPHAVHVRVGLRVHVARLRHADVARRAGRRAAVARALGPAQRRRGRASPSACGRGVRWHDGRPLTAADVAFTYGYMARARRIRASRPQLQDIERRAARRTDLTRRVRRCAAARWASRTSRSPTCRSCPATSGRTCRAAGRAPPGLPIGTRALPADAATSRGRSYRFDANRRLLPRRPVGRRGSTCRSIRRQASIVTELRARRVDAVPLTVQPGTQHAAPRRRDVLAGDLLHRHDAAVQRRRARRFDRLRRAPRRRAGAGPRRRSRATRAGSPAAPCRADRGMLHPQSRWARADVLHRFDPQAAPHRVRRAGRRRRSGVAVARNDPVRRETAAARRPRAAPTSGAACAARRAVAGGRSIGRSARRGSARDLRRRRRRHPRAGLLRPVVPARDVRRSAHGAAQRRRLSQRRASTRSPTASRRRVDAAPTRRARGRPTSCGFLAARPAGGAAALRRRDVRLPPAGLRPLGRACAARGILDKRSFLRGAAAARRGARRASRRPRSRSTQRRRERLLARPGHRRARRARARRRSCCGVRRRR